jgi:hypothetical protein
MGEVTSTKLTESRGQPVLWEENAAQWMREGEKKGFTRTHTIPAIIGAPAAEQPGRRSPETMETHNGFYTPIRIRERKIPRLRRSLNTQEFNA